MSQDPNQKPDDLENGVPSSEVDNDFGDFDFSSFAGESEFGASEFGDSESEPLGFPAPDPLQNEMAQESTDGMTVDETDAAAPSGDDLDLPAFGDSEMGEAPGDAAAPVIEEDDPKGKKKKKAKKDVKKEPKVKKEKPGKAKKEPGEKKPLGLGGVLGIVFGVLLLIGLIGFNVYCLLSHPFKEIGVGTTSIIYYLIVVDIVGLFAVSVPFLLGRYRKDVDFFHAAVGAAVMAMSLGVILLMTTILSYDMTVSAPQSKPATLNVPMEAPMEAAGSEG